MKGEADLREYQRQALQFVVATPRCYLAAKAGAGKTAVALAAIDRLMFDLFEVSRVLVVAPLRVVEQWPREAARWEFGQRLTWASYTGKPREREQAAASSASVMVVSFEHFPEIVRRFMAGGRWPFDLVVFDEASRLRNGGRKGSVTWRAMHAISGKSQARIVLMSGSPRPGTAHELFAPVFLLDQGQRLGRTLTAFRSGYLEPAKVDRHTKQVFSWRLREGMEQALYARIADLYFAVAPDLGLPSVTIDRPVRLPPIAAQACRDLQRHQVVDIEEIDVEVAAYSAGTAAGKLHQMCQGAVYGEDGRVQHLHDEKIDELRQILEEVEGRALVAVWFEHDRQRLAEQVPGVVDITTEAGLAQALRGQVQVAMIHPAAAGHGIDGLQEHYSTIIWFALPASFELYDQTVRRLVRSGQRETVRIYRIVAENGVADPRIVQRLAEKQAEQDRFFEYLEQRRTA